MSRQAEAHQAKIAHWQAMPLPYCITESKWVGREVRSMPIGKRRFATTKDALVAARAYDARHPGKFALVDYAGFHDAA
jgi:hypothetical protein